MHFGGAASAVIWPGQGKLAGQAEVAWLDWMDAAPRQVSVGLKNTRSGQTLEERVLAVEMVG